MSNKIITKLKIIIKEVTEKEKLYWAFIVHLNKVYKRNVKRKKKVILNEIASKY